MLETAYPSATRTITSPFGWRSMGWHGGIDIASGQGTAVVAFAKGTVAKASSNACVVGDRACNGGAGNYVAIDHHNGFFTRYLHLSKVTVFEGQKVRAGDKIGEEGNTGFSTGSHLHFEIRQGDDLVSSKPTDPKPYLEGTVFPSPTMYSNWVAPNKKKAINLAIYGSVALLGGYITYRLLYKKRK